MRLIVQDSKFSRITRKIKVGGIGLEKKKVTITSIDALKMYL